MTRYALAAAMPGATATRRTTLYRMLDPQRVDLAILAEIIETLRAETGEDVSVGDLLVFDPED